MNNIGLRLFFFITFTITILCDVKNDPNKEEKEEQRGEMVFITCDSTIRIRNYLTGN